MVAHFCCCLLMFSYVHGTTGTTDTHSTFSFFYIVFLEAIKLHNSRDQYCSTQSSYHSKYGQKKYASILIFRVGAFWGYFASISGLFLGYFRAVLRLFSDNFGAILWLFSGYFWDVFALFCGYFRAI